MRDIANNLRAVQAIEPGVITADDTGEALDVLGFNAAMVVVETGAIVGGGDFTAKLQESDTTTPGDFSDVDASDLVGALPASLAANSTAKVGYIGHSRYLRTVVTQNGGTSIAASATLILGRPANAPT